MQLIILTGEAEQEMSKSPAYPTDTPRLIPSFVCHVDILGYSELSKDALSAKQGNQFLNDLRTTLTKTYKRVREKSIGWGENEYFSIKTFTDNIVIGYPLPNVHFDFGESELGNIFSIFAEFQVSLAMDGFLVRGGIAFGEHYMDDEIVFGDALLEAVAQDKSGGSPCISLAPSAIEAVQHHLGFYGETRRSPQYQDLLQNPDGTIFLNYLDEAFVAFPDAGIFFEIFKEHKTTIIKGLKEYKSKPDIRAKYEWAARYHNFICSEFSEKYPVPSNPEADEIYIVATEEAKELIKYQIDIESLASKPSRIDLEPIRI